ncbi:hypothetical protein V5799_006882 [Amblyomma americanum]|uniref:Single domain-containing protein n=1 Tax=Amblyomma americanum TaxID=6943 RepID=A0AAQ4DV51_AMBAM
MMGTDIVFSVVAVNMVVVARLASGIDMGWEAVKIHQGMCLYKNQTIPRGAHVDMEKPCQRWSCEQTEDLVLFIGCGSSYVQPPCKTVTGKGAYPHCCPKAVCPVHGS